MMLFLEFIGNLFAVVVLWLFAIIGGCTVIAAINEYRTEKEKREIRRALQEEERIRNSERFKKLYSIDF